MTTAPPTTDESSVQDTGNERGEVTIDTSQDPGSEDGVSNAASPPSQSPLILAIAWGKMEVGGAVGKQKDAKLWPGGGRSWDWGETGTRHSPGIQMADVDELLDHGATAVVLSRGMDEKLGVPQTTVEALKARGIEVHVAETRAAVKIYNQLVSESVPVAGLFHSTC